MSVTTFAREEVRSTKKYITKSVNISYNIYCIDFDFLMDAAAVAFGGDGAGILNYF